MNKIEIILLIITSFLPPIIYSIWIRNTEKFHREKWYPIILSFLWGATLAIVASLILEIAIGSIVIGIDESFYFFAAAVIIAPFVEELTKPLALNLKKVNKEIDELEDGLIYGAVAGLGFSATENLFYGYDALTTGSLLIFIVLISIRSFGACLLHASATAWTGYGMSKKIINKTSTISIIPFFILAFAIHAFYNFVLTYELIGATIGLITALTISAASIKIVRDKITRLDRTHR